MRIDLNNDDFLDFRRNGPGVTVSRCNSKGNFEYVHYYTDSEIVAALNLLDFMRSNGRKDAYLFDDGTRRYLDNLLRSGDIQTFPILEN